MRLEGWLIISSFRRLTPTCSKYHMLVDFLGILLIWWDGLPLET